MPGPFDDLPFGIGDPAQPPPVSFANPFMPKRRDDQFPLLPMPEQQSLLNKIGQSAVSGLGYLGGVLNKPGRALRGLAGGKPEELLALLPFSDAAGITNEDNQVSGKDLLAKMGLVDPHDESWGATLAGIGTEIATDPLTYVNPFAPLTEAGAVAKAAGILPKGLRASMQGLEGGELLRDLTKMDKLQAIGKTAADVGGPLRSLASFSVPFTGIHVPIGTGATAAKYAGYADAATNALKSAERIGDIASPLSKVPVLRDLPNPVPYVRGLFDYSAGGSTIPALQRVFGEEVLPSIKAGRAQAAEGMLGNLRELQGATHYNPEGAINEPGLNKVMSQFAEGRGGNVNLAELGPGSEMAADMGVARRTAQQRKLYEAQELGINLTEFVERTPTGEALFHEPRYATPIAGSGQGNWRNQKLMPTSHPSMIQRDETIRNLPKETVNDLYKDARLSGPNRLYQDPKTAAAVIAQEYLGNPNGAAPELLAKADEARRAMEVATGKYNQTLETVRSFHPTLFDPATGQPTIQMRQFSPQDWSLIERDKSIADAATQAHQDLAGQVAGIQQKQGDVAKQAMDLAKKLAKADPVHAEKQLGIFENNPLTDYARYDEYHSRATANAKGIYSVFKDTAQPFEHDPGPGWVRIDNGLSGAGLTYNSKLGEDTIGAKATMAKMLGVDEKDLGKYWVREDVVNQASKWMKPFVAPESVRPFVDLYDKVTNLFKGAVTQAFPSYHVRNAASGVWQNWITGAFDPTVGHGWNPAAYIKPYQDAKALADGEVVKGLAQAPVFKAMGVTSDEEATRILADKAHALGTAGPNSLTQGAAEVTGMKAEQFSPVLPGAKDYVQKPSLSGLIPRSAEEANPLNLRGVTGDASKFTPVREGEKAQGYIEYVNRMSNMIAKLKQGASFDVASASSKAAHLDYSMLSPFEREVARRVIPFYAWSRRNLPMVVESMLGAPDKFAASVRVANAGRDSDTFLPPYIGEGAAVPLPGAPAGQQRFLSSFGLPLEDEFIGAGASLLKGDVQRAMERMAGTTVPQIKAPLEMLTGKQFYSGRALKDLQPSQLGSMFGLLPNEIAQPLTQVLSNTPLSRLSSVADKLTDPRKDWGTTGVNLLTGARITDADMEKAMQIEGRKLLENMLGQNQHFREFAKIVPNKATEAQMSPQELRLYQLYLGLEREAQRSSLMKQAQAGDQKAAERLQRMALEDRARQ